MEADADADQGVAVPLVSRVEDPGFRKLGLWHLSGVCRSAISDAQCNSYVCMAMR